MSDTGKDSRLSYGDVQYAVKGKKVFVRASYEDSGAGRAG